MNSKLPLSTLIIISLMGCCLELDISVPSFPMIMTHFNVNELQVQNTLSINFLAFCLAGLLYGPLSESWGRRKLMIFGATTFLIGALGCVFSYSIYQLMFWRFVQGLGASSGLVLGFAMISDKYQGQEAAHYIGKINAYITLFLASAPILGSIIINYSTWRVNFAAVALIALIAWLCLITKLPETKLDKKRLRLNQIFKDYGRLLACKEFILLSSIPNLLISAYINFIGSASFYYINSCNLSFFHFAIHQGLVVICFSAMSYFSNTFISKIGKVKAVTFGLACCALGTVLFNIFAFTLLFNPFLITFSMCLFTIGCAFPMSVTFTQSLEVIPSMRGTCSSFIMSSRLLISSAAIGAVSLMFDGSMRSIAIINGVLVSLGLFFYFKCKHRG